MTLLEQYLAWRHHETRRIRFRVNEVSSWVRLFVSQGKSFEAGQHAAALIHIARQLDEFPKEEEW